VLEFILIFHSVQPPFWQKLTLGGAVAQ
jgi:hypothetical protein